MSQLYDFRVEVEIGEDGFRCTLPLDEEADAPARVMILGSSQPFSPGCVETDALHNQLTRTLRENHGIESVCYNLSVTAGKLEAAMNLFERYSPILRPTHVYYFGPKHGHRGEVDEQYEIFRDGALHGYHSRDWLPLLRAAPFLARSRLVRSAGTRAFWSSISDSDPIPRPIRDLGIAVGLVTESPPLAREKRTPGYPDLSYLDLEAACSERSAHFYSTFGPARGAFDTWPNDGHMTPMGVGQCAARLARKIADTY